jgi:hypothetical protein
LSRSAGRGWERAGRVRSPRRRLLAAGIAAVAGAAVAFIATSASAGLLGGHRAPAATVVNANASAFDYTPGAEGTATSGIQYVKGQPGALSLTVYGMPAQDGSASARVDAQLANGSSRPVVFAGGAAVDVTLSVGGEAWRSLVLDQPSVTGLASGQRAMLQATVPLGPAGHYTLAAQLTPAGS